MRVAERYPIELRFVDEPAHARAARAVKVEPTERFWLRLTEPIGDDLLLHACVVTFSSDLLLLNIAVATHGLTHGVPGLTTASLDHAVWFHQPFRADEWYLHEIVSPWAGGGRGMAFGRMFDRCGALLADIVQEGLMAYRPAAQLATQ